jgi:hypothetical protein
MFSETIGLRIFTGNRETSGSLKQPLPEREQAAVSRAGSSHLGMSIKEEL